MIDGWIGLDLRHLLAFRAIAEEGSFKAAARALGYTPSAVSQQIASLERVVGAQLVAREHGRQAFGLTEAGRILLRHLDAIEARLGAAKADIDALADGAERTIRVGAYESVGARLLPELSGRFRERFPETEIEVAVGFNDLVHLQALERGSLDLAFTLVPLPHGPFDSRTILHDPWVLVVQAGSKLADAEAGSLDLELVGRLPLVCFRAPRSIEDTLNRFRDAGVEPNVVLRSDYNDAVQEFAAIGRGVALMPRLAVNPRDERTAMVALGDLIPPREIALAWHGDRMPSPALRAFVALAAEMCAGIGDPNPLRAPAVGDHGTFLRRAGTAGAAGGA